jgi:hypothetical protein
VQGLGFEVEGVCITEAQATKAGAGSVHCRDLGFATLGVEIRDVGVAHSLKLVSSTPCV